MTSLLKRGPQEQVLETQKQAEHSRGVAAALWWASHFTDEETGTE